MKYHKINLDKPNQNMKGEFSLAQLNQVDLTNVSQQELQNLRHIIDSHKTMVAKLNDYASRCQDAQIKQMFTQAAQSAQTTVQQLTNKL